MTAATPNLAASDSRLIGDFCDHRDESAFRALVDRHGPMVLQACQRRLGRTPDAEDAAQATFVTLARRARTLRRHPTLAGWLHRVAYYISTRAATLAARRRRHEQEAARMYQIPPREDAAPAIAPEALDRAIAALPEKYRIALVLHHLEGLSEADTAAALGVSVSAASMRLFRGREKLRQRLSITTAAALGASLLALAPAPASAASLSLMTTAGVHAAAATGAVATLSQGALHMFFWTKIKVAALVSAACLLTTGIGVTTYVLAADKAPATPAATEPATKAADATELHIRLADSGRTLTAVVGQTIVISLWNDREDAGWEVGQPVGESVRPVKIGGNFGGQSIPALEFTPTPDAKNQSLGAYTFRYTAAKAGRTVLPLRLLSPGGPIPQERGKTRLLAEFQVTIDVIKERDLSMLITGDRALALFTTYPTVKDLRVKPSGEERHAGQQRIHSEVVSALHNSSITILDTVQQTTGPVGLTYSSTLLLDLRGAEPETLAKLPHFLTAVIFRDGYYQRALPVKTAPFPSIKVGTVPALHAYASWGGIDATKRQADLARFRALDCLTVELTDPPANAGGSLGFARLHPKPDHRLLEVFLKSRAGFELITRKSPDNAATTIDKAEDLAWKAIRGRLAAEPDRLKRLTLLTPITYVEESKSYKLQFSADNGLTGRWLDVLINAATGEATIQRTPGKEGA